MYKKRNWETIDPMHDVIEACKDLEQDSEKLLVLLNFIENLKEEESDVENLSFPSWVSSDLAKTFLKVTEIIPIEESESSPLKSVIRNVNALVKNHDLYKHGTIQALIEPLNQCTNEYKLLSSSLKAMPTHLMQLHAVTEKLITISKESNVGERVVSCAISGLLDVVCEMTSNKQYGNKEVPIVLDHNLPEFRVKPDGSISTDYPVTWFYREDSSLDSEVSWENREVDSFKLILCLKSLLRYNMEQKLQYEKDDMNTFSKVLGLCYLKTTAFLFLLEARFEELVCKESLEIVPKYFLYSKRFQMGSKIQIFDLFNHVLSFYVNHVPKDEPVTTLTPYRPTISVPLTNWKAVKVLAAEEATSKPKYSGRLRQNKKLVAAVEEEHADRFTYIVKSQTFIKNVSKEELHVITKLLSLDTYTMYLPKILKIYRNGDVEFELLTAIHIHNEEDLLALTIDVCKALKFLHKMNIVHRDVKPSNIMLRRFDHPKNYYWFVLIDFGLSFHFERTDHGLVDSYSRSLVTENAGTHLFKAPEVIAMEAYDERIDIFSLGSTILSLMDQKRFLTTRAKQGNLQDMVGQLNWKYPTFKHVVFDMLSGKSEDRPSASTIVDLLTPVVLDEKYC